jgi:hypothetical protein
MAESRQDDSGGTPGASTHNPDVAGFGPRRTRIVIGGRAPRGCVTAAHRQWGFETRGVRQEKRHDDLGLWRWEWQRGGVSILWK